LAVRTGLVLGAGGVTGAAYLAGALTALEQDLGWDPRDADVIVGTSAGALVGALLRRGVPASDLAAWTVGAALSRSGGLLTALQRPAFDSLTFRQFMHVPRLPHPRAVASVLTRPWRFDPLRALTTHLADGTTAVDDQVAFLGPDWPERTFLCCAVRRVDGRRVVFGDAGDTTPVDGLRAAVAASCAVPGYFAPVTVDGERYIDGGVASPTNADRVRDLDLDLVIVVSPMTARVALSGRSVEKFVRARAAMLLARELRRLPSTCSVATFAPGATVLAYTTLDWMCGERVHEIVTAAFLETGEQLVAALRGADQQPVRRGRPRLARLAAA
jgi:NTE family protein